MAGSPPRKCRVGECSGGVCLSRLPDKARIHWGGCVDGNEYECVGGRWDGGGGWIEGGVRREVEGWRGRGRWRWRGGRDHSHSSSRTIRTCVHTNTKLIPRRETRETRERERETVQMTAVVPGEYM